jgi:hypothetical protein
MYIPKNKIITNLFSNGNLIIKSTQEKYIGPYWKTYEGKYFTGINPNAEFIKELELTTKIIPSNLIDVEQLDDISLDYRFFGETNTTYSILTNNTGPFKPKKPIRPFYPKPTEQNYKLGEFIRYIVKKNNEYKFIEVNRQTYDGLKTQKDDYEYYYYTPIYIPWQISGDKLKVATTNKNIVLLAEKENNMFGLSIFIKGEYLKFFK